MTDAESTQSLDFCSASISNEDGWGFHQCMKQGKVVEDGKRYCTIHAPAYRKAKRAEQERTWEAKRAARETAYKEEQERDRRAACFPELLAALEWALKKLDRGDGVLEYTGLAEEGTRAYAALTKAQETTP